MKYISPIFYSFLRPKSGYFPNEILEFSSLWLLHRLLEMKCVQKKENSLRDLLMHHLSSHFLKVVFCALKLFAVLADFPIVRLISFAWAFILNLLLSFGESLKSRLLFYTTQLGCNSFWRSVFFFKKVQVL